VVKLQHYVAKLHIYYLSHSIRKSILALHALKLKVSSVEVIEQTCHLLTSYASKQLKMRLLATSPSNSMAMPSSSTSTSPVMAVTVSQSSATAINAAFAKIETSAKHACVR
jgi:hypothetical protein